jgi:hypothetical protein
MMTLELYQEICADLFPLFRSFSSTERYSITLGGSQGKKIADPHSDYDFRVYYDGELTPQRRQELYTLVRQHEADWEARTGVKLDGILARPIAQIDEQLGQWLTGKGSLTPIRWTVWGYNLLTDIYNQQIADDPFGIAARWKELLTPYPEAVRRSIVDHHGSSLQFWRHDYHYESKVRRQDPVFTASITSRLINDLMQVLYALNRFYFPGDGMNLLYSKDFSIKPQRLEERVRGFSILVQTMGPFSGSMICCARSLTTP